MNEENAFIVIGASLLSLLAGIIIGANFADNKEKTVIMCIEQPKQCKVSYDYYKLNK